MKTSITSFELKLIIALFIYCNCMLPPASGKLKLLGIIDVCSVVPSTCLSVTVKYLSGTNLILQNNGKGNLSVSGNGTFYFGSSVTSGTSYNVTILTQPTSSPSQNCEVRNGSGMISGTTPVITIICFTGNLILNPVTITGSVDTLAGFAPPTVGGAGTYLDGTGTSARFNDHHGITTDGSNLYIADSNNQVIRKIEISSGIVTTLAGTQGSTGSTDAIGTLASFNTPRGLIYYNKKLYISDMTNGKIRMLDLADNSVTTIATGIGTARGLTTDGTNIYILSNPSTIYSVPIAGGTPVSVVSSLVSAKGITKLGNNLYIADGTSHIVKSTAIGTWTVNTLAGSGALGYNDATGATAQFNNPSDLTTDGTLIYISDTANHSMRKIDPATGTVTNLIGPTATGPLGNDNSSGTNARFNQPKGVTSDGTKLYVLDSVNNSVRVLF